MPTRTPAVEMITAVKVSRTCQKLLNSQSRMTAIMNRADRAAPTKNAPASAASSSAPSNRTSTDPGISCCAIQSFRPATMAAPAPCSIALARTSMTRMPSRRSIWLTRGAGTRVTNSDSGTLPAGVAMRSWSIAVALRSLCGNRTRISTSSGASSGR